MQRPNLILLLALAACGPGAYTRAEVVYAEPPQYVYVVPADRVVVVTREVLVNRGYVVYRVEQAGPDRRRDSQPVATDRRAGLERRSARERRRAVRRSGAQRRVLPDRRKRAQAARV